MSDEPKDLTAQAGSDQAGSEPPDIIIRTTENPTVGTLILKSLAVATLIIGLLWVRSTISTMKAEQQNLELTLTQLQADVARLSAEVAEGERIQNELRQQLLQNRLAAEPAEAKTDPEQTSDTRPIITELKPGLYTVAIDVTLSRVRRAGTIDEHLTLYHITAPLSSDTANPLFNIGLAIGSLASGPQLYIDYDADGKVDAEMLYDFVSLVPYSGFLAKSLSEENSQRTYDAFARNVEKSEYVSLDEIESKGSGVARALWEFVSSQSSRLFTWIQRQKPKGAAVRPGQSGLQAPAAAGGTAPSGQNTF